MEDIKNLTWTGKGKDFGSAMPEAGYRLKDGVLELLESDGCWVKSFYDDEPTDKAKVIQLAKGMADPIHGEIEELKARVASLEASLRVHPNSAENDPELWDAINQMIAASGGDTGNTSVARQKAVARICKRLRELY